MKKYDEIWAVETSAAEEFFREHPGDISVISMPDKKLGPVALPQTRIVIRGDNAEALHRQFLLRFMKGGG